MIVLLVLLLLMLLLPIVLLLRGPPRVIVLLDLLLLPILLQALLLLPLLRQSHATNSLECTCITWTTLLEELASLLLLHHNQLSHITRCATISLSDHNCMRLC